MLLACIPPFPSPQMTTQTVPRGSFMSQWSSLWSEWSMDNDHIENQESVASFLTLPSHKTRKIKITTKYFYYKIKPERRHPLEIFGNHANITPRYTSTHGLEHISDSWLWRVRHYFKYNKGRRYLQNSKI